MNSAVGTRKAMPTRAERCSRKKLSQSMNSESVPDSMVRTTRPEPVRAW